MDSDFEYSIVNFYRKKYFLSSTVFNLSDTRISQFSRNVLFVNIDFIEITMEQVYHKRFNLKQDFESSAFDSIDLLGHSSKLLQSFDFTYCILEVGTSKIKNACESLLEFFGVAEAYFYEYSFYELIVENTHNSDVEKLEGIFDFIYSPSDSNYITILKIKNSQGLWRQIYLNISVDRITYNNLPEYIYACCIDVSDLLINDDNQKQNYIEPKSIDGIDLISLLSKREKEILKLVVHGCTDKEVALQLNISIHTAITHRKNIICKLKVKNTASLAFITGKAGVF